MWSTHEPEYHPVELHELSLEELTGTRPSHKGTLMYLKQKGIPEESIQFHVQPPQKGHLKNLVSAIEHNFYTGPVYKHPEVQPAPSRDRPRETAAPLKSPVNQPRRAMSSRELMTGRRDGRAAALFQHMKQRSDQYVVEDAAPRQGQPGSYPQERRPWQQSPWEAAADNVLGLPDKAFEKPMSKPKSKLQNPAVQKRGPPVYSEVDSIRQHQSAGPQHSSKPPQIGCTWKGETQSSRFHCGVRPYEMNYNRTARGWGSSQQSDVAPGPGHARDDADASWGGTTTSTRGHDYNPRPKSWVQEDQYSSRQQPSMRSSNKARQVVKNVIGPKSWGDESDDL